MKRQEILEKADIPTELKDEAIDYDEVSSFIDSVETRVNNVVKKLEDISCLADLHEIEDCLDMLKDLSQDLY